MRIFKVTNTSDDIERLCCEMLNIESSTKTFDNGKPIVGKIENGYPKITVDDIQYTIKAARGYIFIDSNNTDATVFENLLLNRITKLEKDFFPDGVLGDYQTVENGPHTNVKIKSMAKMSVNHESNKKTNISRQFLINEFQGRNDGHARFTWYIVSFSSFPFVIENTNALEAVDTYLCSIIYDSGNLLDIPDNTQTFELRPKDFTGGDFIINEDIVICSVYNPAAIELNAKFCDQNVTFNKNTGVRYCSDCLFRNINPTKIYQYDDISALNIKPMAVSEKSTEMRIDICFKCRTPLYGENYVLYQPVKYPDRQYGVAICPICLHSCPKLIENKYMFVFRVNFPRTVEEMINRLTCSDVKKQILTCMVNSTITEKRIGNTRYHEIGERYLMFERYEDYLFSGLGQDVAKYSGEKFAIIRCPTI